MADGRLLPPRVALESGRSLASLFAVVLWLEDFHRRLPPKGLSAHGGRGGVGRPRGGSQGPVTAPPPLAPSTLVLRLGLRSPPKPSTRRRRGLSGFELGARAEGPPGRKWGGRGPLDHGIEVFEVISGPEPRPPRRKAPRSASPRTPGRWLASAPGSFRVRRATTSDAAGDAAAGGRGRGPSGGIFRVGRMVTRRPRPRPRPGGARRSARKGRNLGQGRSSNRSASQPRPPAGGPRRGAAGGFLRGGRGSGGGTDLEDLRAGVERPPPAPNQGLIRGSPVAGRAA